MKNPNPQKTGLALGWLLLAVLGVLVVIDASSPSGIWPAFYGLAFLICLFGIGCAFLRCFEPSICELSLLAIAPAAGLVLLCAAAYIAVQLRVDLRFVLWGGLAGAMAGLALIVPQMRSLFSRPVAHGRTIAGISIAICLLYWLPVSIGDSVRTPNGAYQWLYVDSMYHHAIVKMIATGLRPVPDPGMSLAPLSYHFGPQALAAALLKVIPLDAGDVWVRVVRLGGFVAFMGAVAGFSLSSCPREARKHQALIAALIMTFFVCAGYEFLALHFDSSAHIAPGTPQFRLQLGSLPAIDRYKETLIYGSGLWAMTLLFVTMVLLIRAASTSKTLSWKFAPALLLAPLSICMNSLAALSVVGVLAGICLMLGWRRWQNYAFVAGMCVLAYGMLTVGNFASDAASSVNGLASLPQIAARMVDLFAWLTFTLLAGKGIAYAFWKNSSRVIFATLVLFTFGWFCVYLFLQLDWNNQAYAMLFLSSIVGAYAAGPIAVMYCRLFDAPQEILNEKGDGFFAGLERFVILVIGWGTLALLMALAFARKAFLLGVSAGLLLVLGCILFFLWRWRQSKARQLPVPIKLAFPPWAVASILGSVVIVYHAGWNGEGMTVKLDNERVASLKELDLNASNRALIATAHHEVTELPVDPDRSYGYAALAGRRMFLEGWANREQLLKEFPDFKAANDRLFVTENASEAREIARKYGITDIIAEPAQPLRFAPAETGWLRKRKTEGSLELWEVLEENK